MKRCVEFGYSESKLKLFETLRANFLEILDALGLIFESELFVPGGFSEDKGEVVRRDFPA